MHYACSYAKAAAIGALLLLTNLRCFKRQINLEGSFAHELFVQKFVEGGLPFA